MPTRNASSRKGFRNTNGSLTYANPASPQVATIFVTSNGRLMVQTVTGTQYQLAGKASGIKCLTKFLASKCGLSVR
jgi:hypothetical protein